MGYGNFTHLNMFTLWEHFPPSHNCRYWWPTPLCCYKRLVTPFYWQWRSLWVLGDLWISSTPHPCNPRREPERCHTWCCLKKTTYKSLQGFYYETNLSCQFQMELQPNRCSCRYRESFFSDQWKILNLFVIDNGFGTWIPLHCNLDLGCQYPRMCLQINFFSTFRSYL